MLLWLHLCRKKERTIKIVSSKSKRNSSIREPVREVKVKKKKAELPEEPVEELKAETKPEKVKKPKKKKSRVKKFFITLVSIILVLAAMWATFVYSNIPVIKNLREAYIETAMTTMTHKWLAEWFIPKSVIDDVMNRHKQAQDNQKGIESKWSENLIEKANNDFYSTFDELDKASFEAYLASHPSDKKKNLNETYINEAGFDDDGTSIKTKQGDQVLAVDGENGILLVRVEGTGYKGVLAILKHPEDLRVCPAENLGSIGDVLEDLVPNNNGVIGVNASGFSDPGGGGLGGILKGYAMFSGEEYGYHFQDSRKRMELRNDNKMYIVDSYTETTPGTRDAVEFRPALIVDGELLIDDMSGFYSIQPRCCVGQSKDGDVLLLVVEGRLIGRSLGIGLPDCAAIMQSYDAYQAMNMDGGTSAMMWYRGEYITKCSNPEIMCRYLPDGWIYGYADKTLKPNN